MNQNAYYAIRATSAIDGRVLTLGVGTARSLALEAAYGDPKERVHPGHWEEGYKTRAEATKALGEDEVSYALS